jgi:hypothetical protein
LLYRIQELTKYPKKHKNENHYPQLERVEAGVSIPDATSDVFVVATTDQSLIAQLCRARRERDQAERQLAIAPLAQLSLHADPRTPAEKKQKHRIIGRVSLVIVGLLAVVIALGVMRPWLSPSEVPTIPGATTAPPSIAPMAPAPTPQPRAPAPTPQPSTWVPLVELFSSASSDGDDALRMPLMPQNEAYEWIRTDMKGRNYSHQKIIQWYALATFYHSTQRSHPGSVLKIGWQKLWMQLGVCWLQCKGWSWNSNRGSEWPEWAHSTRDWTAVQCIRYELLCDKLMVFMPLNFLAWFLFFCSCSQSIQQWYCWQNSIRNWSVDCFEYVLVHSCGCRIMLRVTYFIFLFHFAASLDLSYNLLTGGIPSETTGPKGLGTFAWLPSYNSSVLFSLFLRTVLLYSWQLYLSRNSCTFVTWLSLA